MSLRKRIRAMTTEELNQFASIAKHLPNQHKELLTHFLAGFTQAELALMYNVSQPAISKSIARAFKAVEEVRNAKEFSSLPIG